MPSVDFEALIRPVSASEPCGPDLDAEANIDFLNYFASVESVLPQSYFRARDPESGELRLFDPKMIAIDRYFAEAQAFVGKTKDIRLTVLLAKLSILNRDLAGFVGCLKALAAFLVLYWDDVHPKGENSDFAYRGIALEALNVAPTVTMPLQFLPLVHDRRTGSISYRNYLTATGAVPAAEGEEVLEAAAIERVLDTCDLEILTGIHTSFLDIIGATKSFREVWSKKNESGESLSFDQLSNEASAIAKWLGDAIKRRSPTFGVGDVEQSSSDENDEFALTVRGASTGVIKSGAQAAAALAAASHYYAIHEASSPARLLISLSEQMIGKTFAEIVRILAPRYVEQAVIKVGTDGVIDLPVEGFASLLDGNASVAAFVSDEVAAEYAVGSRTKALEMIDQVALFFRVSEPSSPIPVLLERIRDLGQRDFLYLLRSVLPADAFKRPE